MGATAVAVATTPRPSTDVHDVVCLFAVATIHADLYLLLYQLSQTYVTDIGTCVCTIVRHACREEEEEKEEEEEGRKPSYGLIITLIAAVL